jgi:beta-glucosidase
MISKPQLLKRLLEAFIFSLILTILFLLSMQFIERTQTAKLLPPPQDAPFRQSTFPDEIRIEDLLSRMTLEEKIGQMALVEKNSILEIDDISEYGLGALLSGFGGRPADNTPAGWRQMVEQFVMESKTSRLGIPILYGVDAIHGHTNVPGATVFPHSLGLGATQNEELVAAIAKATAREIKATGANWTYSPTLDIPRDIRWGRTYETFSDDPALVTRLGAAFVKGTQNLPEAEAQIFVLSTPKHFVGLGDMVWNTSSNENFKIDQGTTVPDETKLQTEYLPAFKAAIDAGALSVMIGLNSWGETKLSSNSYLITDVLKSELNFTGFAVSDWYAVYEISGGEYRATVSAINAGIDMVMLPFDYKTFIKNVDRAVRRGDIAQERIDDAVRRILRAKFAAGLFDEEVASVPITVVGAEEHRALARQAVAQSLVLLKNTDAVLPIASSVKTIRVVGSAADNVGVQSGAWTVEWQGVDGNWLPNSTSILDGIKRRAGAGAEVEFSQAGYFAGDAQLADVGIAIVGEKPYAEGWGDKEFPTLDQGDLEAIKRLQAVSKVVVVIMVGGRPLLVSNEIDTWDGVVMAWLPGSEGGGVADVLFGDKKFTGTLPLPWPKTSEQLPITLDGNTADNTPLLFPRYFGL